MIQHQVSLKEPWRCSCFHNVPWQAALSSSHRGVLWPHLCSPGHDPHADLSLITSSNEHLGVTCPLSPRAITFQKWRECNWALMIATPNEAKLLELEVPGHVGSWVFFFFNSSHYTEEESLQVATAYAQLHLCKPFRDSPTLSFSMHLRTWQNTSMVPCPSPRSCLLLERPTILSITRPCRLSASLGVWGNVWAGKVLHFISVLIQVKLRMLSVPSFSVIRRRSIMCLLNSEAQCKDQNGINWGTTHLKTE